MGAEKTVSATVRPYTSSESSTQSYPPSFTGAKSSVSTVGRLISALREAIVRCSDFLVDWTPFALVIAYYAVSTAVYVLCPAKYMKIIYYFFMCTNFYVAAIAVVEAFLGMSPVREARAASIRVQESDYKWPSSDEALPIMDIVIVAYLPNEKDIVKDQLHYALEELVYPKEKLRINLVYNTPYPMDLEAELAEMDKTYPQLHVIKVENSKSKADNLNYFFTLDTGAEYIGIFDCDHFPHPQNPRWAAERFLADKSVDIVQGRCVVYNTPDAFICKMIALEFDKIYAVSHPGRSRLFGFGLFCGSNGYWRADVLKAHKMHGHMLTEDIDSALRAYGEGKRAVHDMNVISYEMAPMTFGALWKQRMRWAQGWTQASIVHMPLMWKSPPEGKRSLNERYGLFSLLLIREISYYLVSQHTCLLLSFIIVGWPKGAHEAARLIFFQYPMAEWFLFAM